ncbi:cysteine-rich receptor-like protein kinase 43 isoform X2 [Andrographis paniculata]|uniref:cysteine-rich receptor-like protein kinase 43 isoform X2 n=1 Tax=Andrographis paniculata TaxID=175694 RepID=UPI0021E8B30E|nr:cysteine-rich receptor-like protein kinase 43 isoform X2 [Andrographis paniculata]
MKCCWPDLMSKSKSFFRNLFRPFTNHANRDRDDVDIERFAEQEQKQFSFQALSAATKDFHPSLKLGEGGFGAVYQGTLDDGRKIAVKRLSQRSLQGNREFQIEAKLLSRVQHRNVVHLLGFCADGEERLLVYEFIPNDSLDKLLFKSEKRELLDWKRRYDVITGVAKGLSYLHNDANCTIIHRDIKASNILLDDKWVPKIADFGMARLFPEDQTHINTRAAGTNGYMAPEYLMHGNLSKKSDVFSFGVVVLELVTGQKNSTFNKDPDSRSLLEWVYKLYKKDRIPEIIDPLLVASSDFEQISFCVWIGLMCVQSEKDLRPDMERVGVMLSRKPSDLRVPTRPGYPGSRYRRLSRTVGSTVTAPFDTSSSRSYESTSTLSGGGSSTSGVMGSTQQNATPSGSTFELTSPRRQQPQHRRGRRPEDPHGKRPVNN